MSRNALKKELAKMSREQIEQILLDAYDARGETKEYFEFFLNPNVEKLLEKLDTKIRKEHSRMKWGRSKARTTVIKKAVNEALSLHPGVEAEFDILFLALDITLLAESVVEFNDAQRKLGVWLLTQITATAERHQCFSDIVPRLQCVFAAKNARPTYIKYLRENTGL